MQNGNTLAGHASAPGKLMLAGEYAVLDGGRALAVALDGELTVRCEAFREENPQNPGTTIELRSNLWSEPRFLEVSGDDHPADPDPFTDAALTAVDGFAIKPTRIIFEVNGNLDPSHGAGSSSALRLAVLAAARHISADSLINVSELAETALELQRRSQPAASGYDVAVQSRGGLIVYRQGASKSLSSRCAEHLDKLGNYVQIMVGGKGAPTGPTMRLFLDWLEDSRRRAELMDYSEALVDAWQDFLAAPDHKALPALLDAVGDHRRFMANSPVFPATVATALASVPGLDQTWSWKTTGAGGEDAIILIGSPENVAAPRQALAALGWEKSPFNFTQQGLATW